MKSINRTAVIVHPRSPYIEWARGVDDEAAKFSADTFRRESNVYLIPEILDDSHGEELLKGCFEVIFENELGGWFTDDSAWPANRTYDTFRAWFDVEINTIIIDLCNYRLKRIAL